MAVQIAADSETRLKRKARLCRSPSLIRLTEIGGGNGEKEVSKGVISVDLDGVIPLGGNVRVRSKREKLSLSNLDR
jgi:hypothetical protein